MKTPRRCFGHKRLAGAGDYVCQQLSKRLKADPSIKDSMIKPECLSKGINETPEVRPVNTGAFGAAAAIHQPMTLICRRRGISYCSIKDQRCYGCGISTAKYAISDTKEAIKTTLCGFKSSGHL